jgi:hypothetical protein
MVGLNTSGIESSIFSADVESISGEDDKEDKVTSENHTETSVEMRGLVPYVG